MRLLRLRGQPRGGRASASRQPPAEAPLPLEKVATPDCKTIAELAEFLGIPESRTAKAVFYVAEPSGGKQGKSSGRGEPASSSLSSRGDMEVNETKLANAVGDRELRPATEEEIRAVGAEPGYGSPVGVQRRAGGGRRPGRRARPTWCRAPTRRAIHLLNVNCGRDYQPDIVADIVAARDGDACPSCGNPLHRRAASRWATSSSWAPATPRPWARSIDDPGGVKRPIVMGSYGIGVGRLLATVAEIHHDEHGLIWPVSVAPFDVHLVVLPRPARAPEAAGRGRAAVR